MIGADAGPMGQFSLQEQIQPAIDVRASATPKMIGA